MLTRSLLLVSGFGLLAACGGAEGDDLTGDGDALVGGQDASARHPEVGKLWYDGQYCTATLIRQDIAITAAHCVGYGTAEERIGSIEIEGPAGELRAQMIAHRAFGRAPGLTDIALVRLERPVPTRIARAASLSNGSLRIGDPLVIYGFGCDERGAWQSAGKTYRRVSYGSSQVICQGDSGGPGFAADGTLATITSAYSRRTGADILALPPLVRSEIDAQLRAWGAAAAEPAPAPAPPPSPSAPSTTANPLPGARIWKKDGAVSRCSEWTLSENFSSGRYNAHQFRLTLPAGAHEIQVEVRSGDWKPVFVLAKTDGTKIYDGEGNATVAGVETTERSSGRDAELAAFRAELAAPATLDLFLSSWGVRDSSYTASIPRDATYHVEVQSLCP